MTEVQWASFETRLRAYVGSRVESRWVDDVVGDILLKLVRHRNAVKAAGNPLAFVLRVASNAIADHYRRKSVEQRVWAEFESENTDRVATGESTDDAVAVEMARCVMPFIESLPEIYREALLLTDIDGLSQPEAARRLGISKSGMKSRVQRARARIKEALLHCCAVELDRRGGIADYAPCSEDCGDECSK